MTKKIDVDKAQVVEAQIVSVEEQPVAVTLDKVDLEILYRMSENGCTTPVSSYRIKDICDAMEETANLSYHTYSKRLKNKLIPLGYVQEGMRDSRSRTYYITPLGLEILKDNSIDEENESEE